MRRVTTRVFPVPAPARTRSGPSVQPTAFAWASLSPSKMADSNRTPPNETFFEIGLATPT
jgi:hypothetical protein